MHRMKSPRAQLVAGLVGLLSASPAFANSLVDNLGPRSIGMGETMRGSAHGELAVSLNPAGLALSRQLVFEGSYGYRPEDGATRLTGSACDATVPTPGCFYYQFFRATAEIDGADTTRRVHEVGSVFARQISDIAYLGLNLKYFDYRSNIVGDDDASGFALDLGTIVRAGEHVQLGLVGYNVLGEDAAQYPRGVGSGVTLRPVNQVSLALDGVWNLDADDGEGAGRYGLGAEYFATAAGGQAGIPIRVGGVYDAGRDQRFLTAGGGYMTQRAGIDVGARYELGGDELLILVGVRLFGPSFD